MEFGVIVITFQMIFLINKLTNIFIPTYFLFIHFWYILHPNIYVMTYCHEGLKYV